jgi:exodeoxyribonuclease VII small subunit
MSAKKKEDNNFEVSLKRLEEVVGELENQDVDLDKALLLYEEGIKLSRICFDKISDAERKIEILKNGGSLSKEIAKEGKISSSPEMGLFEDI